MKPELSRKEDGRTNEVPAKESYEAPKVESVKLTQEAAESLT